MAMHPSKPGQWHPAGGQALSEAPVLSARAPQAQGPETLPPPSGRPVPGLVPAWGRSSGPRLWHPTCSQAPPGSLPATNHTGLAVGDRLPQPSEPSRGGREVAHVPARRHEGAVPPPHQGQAGRWRMSGGALDGGLWPAPHLPLNLRPPGHPGVAPLGTLWGLWAVCIHLSHAQQAGQRWGGSQDSHEDTGQNLYC